MDKLNESFYNQLINLDTFSRIPKNTDIHLSKTGIFVITAGKMSSFICSQTISNMINLYTIDKLYEDLKLYFENFQDIINQMYKINNNPFNFACKIKLLKREIKFAFGNDELGLNTLLTTHKTNVQFIDNLVIIFSNFINFVNQFNQMVNQWYSFQDDFFPEIYFESQDWEYYIQNSKKLQYETISFYKYYVQYTSSLLYTRFMTQIGIWNWFDKIYTNDNISIYLGAMPMKSNYFDRNDLFTLKDLNIKSVLSVVECFENQSSGWLYTPILPLEWEIVNIKYLQIPICDFKTIPLEKIQICVEYIHWNIINKRNIYVQCRVGKSRSSLIIMAYLIKYLNFTSEEALNYIKIKRPQIQNKHFEILKIYEKSLQK